jgi:hypothetical protein
MEGNLPDEKPDAPVENRPEWIWYCESTTGVPVVTFGRWPKHPQQARYKLSAIQPTEHDHPTPQDHLQVLAERERCARIAEDAGDGGGEVEIWIARKIADSIRAAQASEGGR